MPLNAGATTRGSATARIDRWNPASVLPLILFVILLLAYATWRGQAESRRRLEERFQGRVATAATFIGTWLDELAEREETEARRLLSDETVSMASFERIIEVFDVEAAVLLDARGGLIHVQPPAPDLIGTPLADDYEHLASAVAGRQAVSGVVPSAVRRVPVFAVAVPFDTPSGRRVFSGAFPVTDTPLDPYIRSLVTVRGVVSHLLDGNGQVIVGPGGRTPGDDQARPEMNERDRFETKASIHGTDWQLVVSVPRRGLFAPVSGASNMIPWVVLASTVAAFLIVYMLLLRMGRERDAARRANSALEASLTEQQRLAEALSRFSRHVAHDLRGPIGHIRMAAELLKKRLPPDSDHKIHEIVSSVERSAASGARLITDLLELAEASGTARRGPVNLDETVSILAREVDGLIVRREGLTVIQADPRALEQALRNLLQNTSRYASGPVDVSCQDSDGSWTISVADRGPGLPEHLKDSAFDPFVRGLDGEGTGLGLSIVATVAETHGGRAWYEPRAGGGATFKLEIPKPEPD